MNKIKANTQGPTDSPMQTRAFQVLDAVSEALRMTIDEAARFRVGTVAQIIAVLPFAAGCDEADRTACAHLATYELARRGQTRFIFDHRPSDDIDPIARLRLIMNFVGGDPIVIAAGMARLVLIMVASHRRDIDKDIASGEYSPIASGAWDAEALIELYTGAARFGEIPELDRIVPAELILQVWWGS